MSDFSNLGEAVALAQRSLGRLEKLRTATIGFEAIFMKNLMSSMRRGVPDTGLGETFGGSIYRDMLDQAFADEAGRAGTLGIGDLLYGQLAPLALMQERARMLAEAQARLTGPKGETS